MKRLLYPSCGRDDALYFLKIFMEKIDEFIFADLNFRSGDISFFENYLKTLQKIENLELTILGDFTGRYITLFDPGLNKTYRKIAPSYAIFEFTINNQTKRVILRKGFGQFAILELNDESLDIFIHRGDGTGESGSGIFYLGNRKLKYKPISNIFDKLTQKLKNGALIISDGSNVDFKKVNRLYKRIKSLHKKEVKKLLPVEIKIGNITLRAIDVLDRRYNHTLVWKIEKSKIESSSR